MSDRMSENEFRTLAEMARYDGPYYWRKASVAKLVKRGFAEPWPGIVRAFKITQAGRAAYEAFP